MKLKNCKYHNRMVVVLLVMQFLDVGAKRGPHHPRGDYTIRHTKKQEFEEHLSHDEEHIAEDLTGMHVDHKEVSEMSDEEKSFYYFKIHDTDNNDNLDGLEMIKAATHRHGNSEKDHHHDNDLERMDDELNHIVGVIDDFIEIADVNHDGFLNYPEYVKALNQNIEEIDSMNPAARIDSNII